MSETLQQKIGNLYSKNTEKRRIGYTVSAYKNVLNALQQAFNSQKKSNSDQNLLSGEAPTETVPSRSYSYLGSYDANAKDTVVQGFINNDELKQMSVQLGVFMGYCVQVTTKDGKTVNEYVNKVPSINEDKGHCVISGRVYPLSSVESVDIQYDTTGNYCIGLGVSFVTDVVDYFQHFYGKMEVFKNSGSCSNAVNDLASKGLLYGEIMIPISTSDDKIKNKVIHFKVVVDVKNSSPTKAYTVYIPIPVLLLDDYKDVGNILIEVGEKEGQMEAQIVNSGEGNVKFGHKSKKFDHKKALIEGFTCEDVKKHYLQGQTNDIIVNHKGWGLNNTISQGRARYYLQNSDELSSILNEEIPAEYQESLFRGVLTEDKVYTTEPLDEGFGQVSQTVMEYWGNLGAQIGLSAELVRRAVLAVARKESGGKWEKWAECKVRRNGKLVGDGQGISAGYLQFTQKAGGIKDYRDIYVEKQKTDPSAPAMSQSMYDDIGAYNEQNNAAALDHYATEFGQQSKTTVGQMSQLLAWEGRNENKGKRDITVAWFKKFGCSTAAELKAVFGAVNHLPNYFNKTGFPKWKDKVDKCKTPIEKAIMIEKIHWAGHKDWKPGSSVQTTDPLQINNNTVGGFRYRYKTIMKLFNNKKDSNEPNPDLEGVDEDWWERL